MPHADKWRKQHYIDKSVWKKAGELGLVGVSFPEEYGGHGGTYAHDVKIGDQVVIHLAGPVDTAKAAAAIAAGVEVEAAAAGKVQVKTTGRSLGLALTAATAADQTIEFVRV